MSIKYNIYDLLGITHTAAIIYSRKSIMKARERLYQIFYRLNPAPSRGKLSAFALLMKRVIPLGQGETKTIKPRKTRGE